MPIRFADRLACRSAFAVLALGLLFALPFASSGQAMVSGKNIARWERDLQAGLIAENFDSLDQIADRLRSEKTRLPGGQGQLQPPLIH